MPVKTINQDQKELVVQQFKAKMRNQRELANAFGTSERTIHRVLVEAGLATAVPRLKGEAADVMRLLKAYKVSVADLHKMLAMRKQEAKDQAAGQARLDFSEPKTGSLFDKKEVEQIVAKTTEPTFTPDPDDEWLVGEFKSSSNPDQPVLILSKGAVNIERHAKHPSFIRWVGGPGRTSLPQVTDTDIRMLHAVAGHMRRSESPRCSNDLIQLAERLISNTKATVDRNVVFDWLVKQSSSELSALMYEIGLVKISEIHNQAVLSATLKHQQKAEANAKQAN